MEPGPARPLGLPRVGDILVGHVEVDVALNRTHFEADYRTRYNSRKRVRGALIRVRDRVRVKTRSKIRVRGRDMSG